MTARTAQKEATDVKLMYGLNDAVPATAKAAWGCRAIVTTSGVDFVRDRADCVGSDPADRAKLLATLNERCGRKWIAEADALLAAGWLRSDHAETLTLWEDDVAKVVGNTNASRGYLYVAAWMKEEGR